jgi:hypothetical protein
MNNAFTLGHTESYNESLSKPEPVTKLGRYQEENGDVYEGGIVFRTKEDAESYLKEHPELPWSVYGLVLPNGWEQDVRQPLPGENFQRLLNNARIVRLDEGA